MSKITYTDKVALNINPNIADINKVNDTDMNMIKNVVNANETKILLAISDTAPAECSLGDMYFNTTNNLIYTSTGTDTWGSTGVVPTENTIYVVIDTQTSYIYDGTTLISVGGGSGGIVVAPDTPTEDTILYIESTDLDFQGDIVNDIYSTDEIKTNKVWTDGKPIYRKVISYTSPSTADTFASQSTGITNMDTLISLNAYIYRAGFVNSIPFQESSSNYAMISYGITTGNLPTKVGSGMVSLPIIAVLEYTKTGGNN